MKTFTDNMDRKWNVEIVYQTIRRVRDALKVNLAEPDEGETPLASRLQSDLCLFCDVLYVICKPQADALNVIGRGVRQVTRRQGHFGGAGRAL
jgi:hypothetical protein